MGIASARPSQPSADMQMPVPMSFLVAMCISSLFLLGPTYSAEPHSNRKGPEASDRLSRSGSGHQDEYASFSQRSVLEKESMNGLKDTVHVAGSHSASFGVISRRSADAGDPLAAGHRKTLHPRGTQFQAAESHAWTGAFSEQSARTLLHGCHGKSRYASLGRNELEAALYHAFLQCMIRAVRLYM